MYKVEGFTNYECTCGDEEVFGECITLQEALDIFLRVIRDDVLDFSYLDSWIDDWADEDECFGSYGGSIRVYEDPVDNEWGYRDILLIRIERDPIKKMNSYDLIEFDSEITNEEKEICESKIPVEMLY